MFVLATVQLNNYNQTSLMSIEISINIRLYLKNSILPITYVAQCKIEIDLNDKSLQNTL